METAQHASYIAKPHVTGPHSKMNAGPNSESFRYGAQVVGGMERFREESRNAAQKAAKQRIASVLGALAERFGATSAWLFVKQPGSSATTHDGNVAMPWIENSNTLSAEHCHNAPTTEKLTCKPIPMDCRHGVVGHVAATRRPFLSHNVAEDTPPYKDTICGPHGTKSELAVPIMASDEHGDDRLIGVLNLESGALSAFLEAHKGELTAAATELAPEILVLDHLAADRHAFGWHPTVYGWTLGRLLGLFSAAVSDPDNLDATARLPAPSTTIWHWDHQEDVLYVRATARYDYEYVSQRVLPIESFTGDAAQARKEWVAACAPGKLPVFKRPRKSEAMGLDYAFAGPVYIRGSNSEKSAAVVTLYYFRHELNRGISDLEEAFPKWLVTELSLAVGRIIDGCQKLRAHVASAYLKYRLSEHSIPDATEFETVREVLLECLDAQYCSLFAKQSIAAKEHTVDSWKLQCVSTTGLQKADGSAVDIRDASYRPNKHAKKGIAIWLMEHPTTPKRYRSVVHLFTKPVSKEEPVPTNEFRESLYAGTEHRPFVAIAVCKPGLVSTGHDSVGVVRLLRSPGSRPFVDADARLLERLARQCYSIFSRWGQSPHMEGLTKTLHFGARFPKVLPLLEGLKEPDASGKMEAILRLATPLPLGVMWNKRQIHAVLLDITNVFRNPDWRADGNEGDTKMQGGLFTNLRLAQPKEKRRLRVFALHELLAPNPPDEDVVRKHEDKEDSIGLRAVGNKVAITFDRKKCQSLYNPIAHDHERVVSGACMPLRFMSRWGAVWGALSIDCDDLKLRDWRFGHLDPLGLAAVKLGILARANRSPWSTTKFVHSNWEEAVERFTSCLGPNLGDCTLTCRLHFQDRPLIGSHAVNEGLLDFTDQPIDDVRWTQYGGFHIKLWHGPFPSDFEIRGHIEPVDHEFADRKRIPQKLVDICLLWDRFVGLSTIEGKPIFKLSFMRSKPIDGMVKWRLRAIPVLHPKPIAPTRRGHSVTRPALSRHAAAKRLYEYGCEEVDGFKSAKFLEQARMLAAHLTSLGDTQLQMELSKCFEKVLSVAPDKWHQLGQGEKSTKSENWRRYVNDVGIHKNSSG